MDLSTPTPARLLPPPAGLLFRPEYVWIAFALAFPERAPEAAVLAGRAAMAGMGSRLSAVAPGARVVLRDVAFPTERPKSSADPLRVDGIVEIDLPAGDVWERAARIAQVTSVLRGLMNEGRKDKPSIASSFAAPVGLVRDPERHRAEILASWVARTKEMVNAVKDAGAQLAPIEGAGPGPVVQHPISIEQVELRLLLPLAAAPVAPPRRAVE